jgi:GTPase
MINIFGISMNIDTIINNFKITYPKLYISRQVDNHFKLGPEPECGNIEYKRTLTDCNLAKIDKYATQMKWRAYQTYRNYAVYYIGVDDDGLVVGLEPDEIVESLTQFINIASKINGSIVGIRIISVNDTDIIKIGIKVKKEIDYFTDI